MDTVALESPVNQIQRAPSLKAIAALVVLAAFTVFITWHAVSLETFLQREGDQPALVDEVAPTFSATTLDGRTVSLADFRGQKKVIVSFWASWCGPCRMEMPSLVKFYQDNHNPSSDFELLAVSIDDVAKDASDFAATQKLNFPVLLDPGQKMANSYLVHSIPTMFVIDKDGKVIYGHTGFDADMEYELAHELGIKLKSAAGER
jgi:peroxiredoxin